MRRAVSVSKFFAKGGEGRGVSVVAVNVAKKRAEFLPGGLVEATVLLERVFGAGFQLVEIPSGLGNADYWNCEGPAFNHCLQSGKDFFICEVAGGAEEDEGVGVRQRHGNFSISLI